MLPWHTTLLYIVYIGTIVGRVALFHLYTLRINCNRTLYPTCNWCSPLHNSQQGQLDFDFFKNDFTLWKFSRIEACTCWGDGAMDLNRVIARASKYRENLQNYTFFWGSKSWIIQTGASRPLFLEEIFLEKSADY